MVVTTGVRQSYVTTIESLRLLVRQSYAAVFLGETGVFLVGTVVHVVIVRSSFEYCRRIKDEYLLIVEPSLFFSLVYALLLKY